MTARSDTAFVPIDSADASSTGSAADPAPDSSSPDSSDSNGSASSDPLTPQDGLPPRRNRRARRLTSWAVVLVALAGIGYLLYRTLDDASLFFLSVDRAVEQRADLGNRRFQMHGTPVPETIQLSISRNQTFVRFSLAGEDTVVDVLHTGAPPDLFQPCVPVVLRGRWQDAPASQDAASGYHFASTQILVKHDNDYTLPEASDDTYGSIYNGTPRTADNHQAATLAKLEGCPNA